MDLRSQVAADLLLAAPRRCGPRRSAKRSRKRWLHSRSDLQQLQEPMRAGLGELWWVATSSKSTTGRQRVYLSSGHEFARKSGM